LFADAIIKQHPFLPIIDESILDDRHYRDQFIENVFCYAAFQANTGEFIREYGLRWVLRTGNNISVLENASLDKLEELFFKPMNQFITVLEKANNLSGALKNNPQIFSFPESRVEDLITEYANDQVSFVCLAQSIGDLLSINNVSGYSLLFSDDELDLRMQ
ncbi:MAG: hypothetical protein OEM38_05610, partial [Gammaproteobacteria bacterium]|nr:hypothetical protein [Gammaproteobacteria bacterium]